MATTIPLSGPLSRSTTINKGKAAAHATQAALNPRRWIPESIPARMFVGTTLVESGINITILSVVISRYGTENLDIPNAKTGPNEGAVLPVYIALFCLAHIFQLYCVIDAIWQKNIIQVYGTVIFNAMFLGYAGIQITEIREQLGPTTRLVNIVLIVPIIIGVVQLMYIGLAYFLFREFGWLIWKKIGADRKIRKIYLYYQIFVCILKFDYFFFISFSIQFFFLVKVGDIERYVTLAAIPVSLFLLIAGYYVVRKELLWPTILFLLGCCAGGFYFSYKLMRIYQRKNTVYFLVVKSLSLFSALSLSALLLTLIFGIICTTNYNKGLLYHIQVASKAKKQLTNPEDLELGPHKKLPEDHKLSRMSID